MIGRTFHIPAPEPFRETFVPERFTACTGGVTPAAGQAGCEVVLMGSGMIVVPPRSPAPLRVDDRLTTRHHC
jgi:hypothetical protein